ncbi:hypothetical protein K438DRAFT_1436217, partial [Mycena galopus ATCC 62051]
LARAFDEMLARFGIQDKMLSWTGDNATSNDTQDAALDASPNNNYESDNHVRCFNHSLNL